MIRKQRLCFSSLPLNLSVLSPVHHSVMTLALFFCLYFTIKLTYKLFFIDATGYIISERNVPDSAFSASSHFRASHAPYRARIDKYYGAPCCWSAGLSLIKIDKNM